MCNSYIDKVVAINDIHFHRFLMWVIQLVHDAIHMMVLMAPICNEFDDMFVAPALQHSLISLQMSITA